MYKFTSYKNSERLKEKQKFAFLFNNSSILNNNSALLYGENYTDAKKSFMSEDQDEIFKRAMLQFEI